jgi:hypothetical protein
MDAPRRNSGGTSVRENNLGTAAKAPIVRLEMDFPQKKALEPSDTGSDHYFFFASLRDSQSAYSEGPTGNYRGRI